MLYRLHHSVLGPTGGRHARSTCSNHNRLTLSACFAFLVLLAVLFTAPPARPQDQDEVKGMPAEPANAPEIRRQIAAVQKLEKTLPDRGAALYFLSVANERLHQTRKALDLLKECLALHEGFDPSGDPAFLEFKDSKEFIALIAGVHNDFPATMEARESFRTTEKDLVPEGLAYDSQRNVFYLSSLNRRKIVEIGRDGKISDFVPEGRYDLLPVLGIRVDPNDGSVWADSFTYGGKTELLHFSPSGKLLGRFKPASQGQHGFNDLIIRKSGEVITTDSLANVVYRFEPSSHTFKLFPVHRPLFYPNGIAFSGDDRSLFVADSLGVIRVDLLNGSSRDVDPGPRSTLAGIDGLYWHKGSLIGIQNGIGSPRVAAFQLSSDSLHVARTTVLENRSYFCVLPTTGAILGSDFFFIANSQIDNMNDDRVMDVTRLQAVRVGVLRLP